MHPNLPYGHFGKEKKGINDPKGCLINFLLFLVIVGLILTLNYVLTHYFGIRI